MMRSLYSGISGLRNHQTRMDVIGNNIANVNTTGFKASRVVFQDIFSQTLGTGMGNDAAGGVGGTNPIQVGLGMSLSTIDVLHTGGIFQSTGNALDMMIEGDGFFIVEGPGGEIFVTRAGNFGIDDEGYLVTANGEFVLNQTGTAGAAGRINVTGFVGISVNEQGEVEGFNAAGVRAPIATLGIAMFTNPNGLERVGNSLYRETQSSDVLDPGVALAGGRGRVSSHGLEMSNVELSSEFTDMIVTQRGFQANSRIITVSDTMLEELVNLKR